MTADFDRGDLDRFRAIIAGRLGLQFDEGKQEFLADILRQRLEACHSSSAAYLQGLSVNGRAEMRLLASDLTVSETYFFRNPNQFRSLAELALPERIRARGSARGLRLLSAGCASGEEAYSLAMTLRDVVPDVELGDVRLQGLDVNPAMIAKAEGGRYTAWSLRETPPAMRARYFVQEGGAFALAPAVRAMVSFEERNLTVADADFWRVGGFDIIFCRNLLMYLVPDTMQAVVERLAEALAPDGFLYLGHAETLRGLSHDFHLCHTHDTFYYQKKDGAGRARPSWPAAPPPASAPPATEISWTDASWVDVIQAASERIQKLARRGSEAVAGPPVAPNPAARELDRSLDLLRREKYREALEVLDALPPESAADAQLLRAVLLINCGEIPAAEALCAQLLAADDLQAGLHYLMALCREHAGDSAAARRHDCLAVHLDPAFAIPHLHLGLLARRAGDREAAVRELREATTLLQREDASRVLLFGGGFNREALLDFARAQLSSAGGGA